MLRGEAKSGMRRVYFFIRMFNQLFVELAENTWNFARDLHRSTRLAKRHALPRWSVITLVGCLLASSSLVASSYFSNLPPDSVTHLPLRDRIEKPIIIMLLIDTLRPDHMSTYGYSRPTTPFIDEMAREGVVFTNHFSNSTWTKPSVVSLLTGLFPRRHTVLTIPARLPKQMRTVAQLFRDNGFRTSGVMANSFAGKKYGIDRGFDRFAEPASHFGGKSPDAEVALSLCLDWIKQDKDNPIFLTVFLFDPHDPYTPYPPYRQQFCPDCQSPEINSPWREYHGRGPSPKQISDMKSLFDGEIRYMDDQIRRFYQALEKLGLKDRMSTILVGDHGEAFGEHKVFEHAFHMWDEVVRTPLIISSSRLKKFGYYSGLTQHVDVAPTLLKLAGLPLATEIQGHSLVQEANDPPPEADRFVVSEVEMYGIHRVSVRNQQYKLIHHDPLNEGEFRKFYEDIRFYPSVAHGKVRRELYDLSTDPREMFNIYESSKTQAADLERLLEYYQRTGSLDLDLSTNAPAEEVLEDLNSLGYIQ